MEPDTVDAIEGTEYFVYSVLTEPVAPVGSGTESTHKVLKTYKRVTLPPIVKFMV